MLSMLVALFIAVRSFDIYARFAAVSIE